MEHKTLRTSDAQRRASLKWEHANNEKITIKLRTGSDPSKAQIRAAYIQQLMASDDVTSQINAAVAAAGDAAKQVAELKGQLDRCGAFYQGLQDYTAAVSDAAAGAKALKLNLDTLSANTGTLRLSVGELNEAVQKLLHLFGLD